MRRISLTVFVLTSSLLFVSLPSNAAALNAPGTKCVKVGAVAKSGTVKVKCTRSGKKLSWQKINGTAFAKFTPSSPPKNWDMVISSSDGTRLIAIGGDHTYISTNTGLTWATHVNGLVDVQFTSFASSSDGKRIFAAAWNGDIYSSSNSGITWTSHPIGLDLKGPNLSIGSIAFSSDGRKLVAFLVGPTGLGGGPIYTSTDSGASWAAGPSGSWSAVASSSDGKKLVAAEAGGQINTSSDSGITWTAHAPSGSWSAFVRSIVSSDDGSKLSITSSDQGGNPWYRVYTSLDSGATWTAHGPIGNWRGIASSKDGATLVADWNNYPNYGFYTSTDSGTTWTALALLRSCGTQNALSGDGTILITICGGQIYVVHK